MDTFAFVDEIGFIFNMMIHKTKSRLKSLITTSTENKMLFHWVLIVHSVFNVN